MMSLSAIKKFIKLHTVTIMLFSILLLAFFLRFYNTPARYDFNSDSIRDALVGMFGAQHLRFPLVGPFSSQGPFTFGPLYYWSVIFVSFLPYSYAPWVFMGILSLCTVYIMYKIGEELEGPTLGIVLSILATVSPVLISTSETLSNLSPVPFFASLSILFFIKIAKRKNTLGNYLLLGTFLGLGINSHYQMAGLLILPAILLFTQGKSHIKHFCVTIAGIIITFIPLIIFNFLHQFHTIKGFIITFTILKKNIYIANSWTIYMKDFWPHFLSAITGLPVNISLLLCSIACIAITRLIIKKKLSKIFLLLFIAFFINFLFLRYYTSERNYVYFLYLNPLIFILLGYGLYSLRYLKGWNYLLITILVVFSGYVTISQIVPHFYTSQSQIEAKKIVSLLQNRYPNTAVSLYSCTDERMAEGIALIMPNQKSSQEKTINVGIFTTKCAYPLTSITATLPTTTSAKLNKTIFPSIYYNVLDFSNASISAIMHAGYKLTSAQSVYQDVSEWWFK